MAYSALPPPSGSPMGPAVRVHVPRKNILNCKLSNVLAYQNLIYPTLYDMNNDQIFDMMNNNKEIKFIIRKGSVKGSEDTIQIRGVEVLGVNLAGQPAMQPSYHAAKIKDPTQSINLLLQLYPSAKDKINMNDISNHSYPLRLVNVTHNLNYIPAQIDPTDTQYNNFFQGGKRSKRTRHQKRTRKHKNKKLKTKKYKKCN